MKQKNPVNRAVIAIYRPAIHWVLKSPLQAIAVAVLLLIATLWPLSQLGSEFMPDLDEGDLLYMPTTFPGVSIGKAQELLQQTDKLIRTVPEVHRVIRKIGRADTATDPAPLTMIETTIQLKPRDQWRDGMTMDKLMPLTPHSLWNQYSEHEPATPTSTDKLSFKISLRSP